MVKSINYKWSLKDLDNIEKNNLNVFSTFACGGGSSMGYKLAGFNVIGANDIDPKMAEVYKLNHHPKYYYLMPINDLVKLAKNKELPKELYKLDILDGSPPCSTFSMAGSREKGWKKDKQFREGQAKQVLSDLFFDWIDLVNELQPKIAIAENVKGMLIGNAKAYTQLIMKKLNEIGYDVQLFLLDSSLMGIPQKRERVFFICKRKDINYKTLNLNFKQELIPFREVENNVKNNLGKPLSEAYKIWWEKTPPGKSFSFAHPKGSFFNTMKVNKNNVLNTITATTGAKITHWEFPNEVSNEILGLAGSFPIDYNYIDIDPKYLIGMSVPPLMTYGVASEIYKQLIVNTIK